MSLSTCDDLRPSANPASSRRGLTLLELIIALGILAVLSTIAVSSLDPLADQTRYEATQRLLGELRIATVGDPFQRQINGQRITSGFIADTGVLPSTLADLTTQPAGLITYTSQAFDSDRDGTDDVSLSSGWRGPYVRLGAGQSELLDGWGRAVVVDPDGGDFDFTSYGSDNDSVAPEQGYRADLRVTMPSTEYTANLVFRVFAIDSSTGTRIDPSPASGEQLGVLLYCVNGNGGTTGAVEEIMLPIAASGTFEASRTACVHGIAAARGLLWSDTDADSQLDAGETVLRSSYVHYFTVVGGSDIRTEMELR